MIFGHGGVISASGLQKTMRGPVFDSLAVPFGAKMLFNIVKLRPGVSMDDVELAIGEMCNVVQHTYGGDKGGFCGGQVFRFSGSASEEGSARRRDVPAHAS